MKHTSSNHPKILVVGAGSIGGITAAHISKAGYDVEVAVSGSDKAEKINTSGLKVIRTGGTFTSLCTAVGSIHEIKSKKDIILIATKANVLKEVVNDIKPIVKASSVVVSLQNGICEDYLVGVFGQNRVCGCIVGWGATVIQPGIFEMTSAGSYTLGRLGDDYPNHYDAVGKILSSVVPVHYTHNLIGSLYSKLIINSCITTLGAISGMTLGSILKKRKLRNIFIQIICEAVEVAKAKGISIEKYAGSLNFYDFAEDNSWWGNIKKHLLIRIIGFKYRKLKSSSLQSLEKGKKTEIDYLNGYICENAQKYKIQTPLNNLLVRMVKEIETGTRQITIKNFDLQYFNQYQKDFGLGLSAISPYSYSLSVRLLRVLCFIF